jgi:hypothetical protein
MRELTSAICPASVSSDCCAEFHDWQFGFFRLHSELSLRTRHGRGTAWYVWISRNRAVRMSCKRHWGPRRSMSWLYDKCNMWNVKADVMITSICHRASGIKSKSHVVRAAVCHVRSVEWWCLVLLVRGTPLCFLLTQKRRVVNSCVNM